MGQGAHSLREAVLVEDVHGGDPIALQDLTTVNGGSVTEASSGHGVIS